MAKKRPQANASLPTTGSGNSADASPPLPPWGERGWTGRYLVVFTKDAIGKPAAMMASLKATTGAKAMAAASDFAAAAVDPAQIAGADAVVFDELGIAVTTANPTAVASMSAAVADDSSNILSVEREGYMYPLGLSKEYLRGFKDASSRLYDSADETAPPTTGRDEESAAEFMAAQATSPFTWGINAVRANTSGSSGQGVKVAILDTGFDLDHPDFAGRLITSQSFIQGQSVQDLNGHGTHCAGTACGPLAPGMGTRYGIAHQAHIFIGKVLNNQGNGSPDGGIIGGMNWAVNNGCQVISMSLGGKGNQQLPAYQIAGQRALDAGCLVIAAAGNRSNRSRPDLGPPSFPPYPTYAPVDAPANSGTIMAVAAIDRFKQIAWFSNRSSSLAGGKVDISGPGVAVLSSFPDPGVQGRPARHGFLDGTSQATPHVAGCAALWCQATGATGAALYQKLVSTAAALDLPSIDCGTGLVQAPQ